jgi:geranylgeranyl pyrophosphate synthase
MKLSTLCRDDLLFVDFEVLRRGDPGENVICGNLSRVDSPDWVFYQLNFDNFVFDFFI